MSMHGELTRRGRIPFATLFAVLAITRAVAATSDIQPANLPTDPLVKATYATVVNVEPLAATWQAQWNYTTPKSQVAAKLAAAVRRLQSSAQKYPHNEELQLLIGVAGTLGHNVDVPGSFEAATAAFHRASQLDPNDLRPVALLGALDCSAPETIVAGMRLLLGLESSRAPADLPSAFWYTYMVCAGMTNMPAHELRAASYMQARGQLTDEVKFLADTARHRFSPTSPSKTYDPKDIWTARRHGKEVHFFSTTCGFGFLMPADWRIKLPKLQHGTCVAILYAGPFLAKNQPITPEILVLARAPKPGESLSQFAQNFPIGPAIKPSVCPAQKCLTFENQHHDPDPPYNGLAITLTTVFGGTEPEFPGLIFESPQPVPAFKDNGTATFFRPDQIQQRLAPSIYYLVMLDTAGSVQEPAMRAYRHFLSGFVLDAGDGSQVAVPPVATQATSPATQRRAASSQ